MTRVQPVTPTLRGDISTLLIASHNEGKVREISELLINENVSVVSAGALQLPEPEETGSTFAENAILKAKAATQATGLWALADDSGLAVEALGGAPGIYSARWAGPNKDFAAAMQRIEQELKSSGAPAPWKAAFICVLCLAGPDGQAFCFEGRIDGVLTFPPRGTYGFGYDPIFIAHGDKQTFAELDPSFKNAISHRGRALRALKNFLSTSS